MKCGLVSEFYVSHATTKHQVLLDKLLSAEGFKPLLLHENKQDTSLFTK